MYLAIALLGSAVVGAVGSTAAAGQQQSGIQSGQQLTQQEFNTITQQEQPFLQGGYGALNQLDYLMGIGPNSYASQGTNPSNTQVGPGYTPGGGAGGVNGIWGPGGARLQSGVGGTATAGQGIPAATGAGTGQATGQPLAGGYGSLNAPFTADMMKQYSPAYQFQLQQGGQGVLNQDSAAGGAESGGAMKDLMGYNQNLANTAFNNAFNQYQTQQSNTYSRLMGLTNTGSSAAANLGAQGTQLAGNQASLAASYGAAGAAGTVGATNAISNNASMVPWLMSYNNSVSNAVLNQPGANYTAVGAGE